MVSFDKDVYIWVPNQVCDDPITLGSLLDGYMQRWIMVFVTKRIVRFVAKNGTCSLKVAADDRKMQGSVIIPVLCIDINFTLTDQELYDFNLV